jgi:hypothetical protein
MTDVDGMVHRYPNATAALGPQRSL